MGVREVGLEDLPAVAELFVAAGWPAPRRQDWIRLWVEKNAALESQGSWYPTLLDGDGC